MEADESFDTDLEGDIVCEELEIAEGNDEVENSGQSVQDIYLRHVRKMKFFPHQDS